MVKTGVCPYLFVINNDGWVARPFVSCVEGSFVCCPLFFLGIYRHFVDSLFLTLVVPVLAPFSVSYEIERQIHGEKAKYNNIQMLDHQMMLPFFVGRKTVRFSSVLGKWTRFGC